jgi:hypothetical protein
LTLRGDDKPFDMHKKTWVLVPTFSEKHWLISAVQPGALLHGPRLAVHSAAACVGQAAAVRWAHTAAPLPRRDGQGYRLVVLWRSA